MTLQAYEPEPVSLEVPAMTLADLAGAYEVAGEEEESDREEEE